MLISTLFKRNRSPKHDISEGQLEQILLTSANLALIFLGFCALVVALQAAHSFLVPVSLAVIVGLVFGPIADWLEQRGVPVMLSGLVVVAMLVGVILVSVGLFAVPLADWVKRAPIIWEKIRVQLLNWKEPLAALTSMQDQIATALGGGSAVEVSVKDANQFLSVAMLAPSILGDILIFLVSFYFYISTRENIRASILGLCVTRRMRWRTAHVFRDVEGKVSRFLLSVTFLNVCVGVAMTLAAWALGMPSPLLWGALAGVLNYIPYVGQAVMIAVLLAVGFGTQSDLVHILLPVGSYLVINLLEGQFIFPQFVGRTMTMNPFLIFLSIIFWIWVWGPVGSLVAVPALIILQSVFANILPLKEVKPRRPVRRTASMSDKDMVLANAARAIKEQAEDLAKAAQAADASAHVAATEPAKQVAQKAVKPASRPKKLAAARKASSPPKPVTAG